MTFKQAVQKARLSKHRYIERMNDATCLFDVVKYNPSLLQDEDLWADDWMIAQVGGN